MAQTPLTNSTSYLSAAQMLLRVDPRTVGDLCSRDGVRVSASGLLSDTVLAAALLDASGEIEAAAMKGARYAPEDLVAIAATTGASQGKMFRMIARLALVLLYEQRPDHKEKPTATFQAVQEQLRALEDGISVFGTLETADAQVMEATTETAADVENRRGTTYHARRYFGLRANRSSDYA